MLKEYKIGDKVLLRKGSDFYDLAPGKIGVIVELRFHDPNQYYYQVEFILILTYLFLNQI